MTESREKVEVLKVWYSVFCTLMDTYHPSDPALIKKLLQLRTKLAEEIPEVEEEMRRHAQ